MRRGGFLILIQALFSALSGYLFSKMSFVGRVGISVAFREYGVLKVWWQTAIILFVIQLMLITMLFIFRKLTGRIITRLVAFGFLLIGLLGAYFTYQDFTSTSHKLMRFYFHLGGYLFWAAWAVTCVWFLFTAKGAAVAPGTDNPLPAKSYSSGPDYNPDVLSKTE
ncbi:hypothetical protein SAMN05216436_12016 [bacterium A37T11]|nr:hypothetical protein SAMN05216436_12016 [bacterium A37T11]